MSRNGPGCFGCEGLGSYTVSYGDIVSNSPYASIPCEGCADPEDVLTALREMANYCHVQVCEGHEEWRSRYKVCANRVDKQLRRMGRIHAEAKP